MIKHRSHRALAAVGSLVAVVLAVGAVSTSAAVVPVQRVGSTSDAWEISTVNGVRLLTWQSPTPLPVGGAAPEFRVDSKVIGYPSVSADLRTLSLPLSNEQDIDLGNAQAWLSGARLDSASSSKGGVPAATQAASTTARRTLSVDPGVTGPWATTASDYELDPIAVPDLQLQVPTVGHVVAPVDAPGARPLVLFLHGRHPSCYVSGTDNAQLVWPCPEGWDPIPSHLGFRYLQRLLASQGYITVSIAANAIDGQETYEAPDFGASARAALVRHHLSIWADWAADGDSPWFGHVDMDAVTLVGHSRGGEGVNRVAITSPTTSDYTVNGLVLIAPTNFGRQAAPGIPTVVLLGYCDGDATDLAGQGYVDLGRDFAGDTSLRSAALVMGANHNYFNTEWTPGEARAFAEDDWREPNDPTCGPGAPTRLDAAAQREVAATYVAGGVQLMEKRDPRLVPMFDGSRVRVPSAGDADVRTAAVGGRRRLVAVSNDLEVATSGSMSAYVCPGQSSGPAGVCGEGVIPERTPHWPLGDQPPFRPGQPALELSWSDAYGRADIQLPTPLDLSTSKSVDARVIVSNKSPQVRLNLRLTDVDGSSEVLVSRNRGRLDALPGSTPLGKLLAQTLRAPIAGSTDVDLSRIASIGLMSRSAEGRVWLLDVAGRQPGLAPPSDVDVPVLRVPNVSEPEGSASDLQQIDVTVVVARGQISPATPVAVRAMGQDGSLLRRTTVMLEPGESEATFSVPIQRDDLDDLPGTFDFNVFAFATTGTAVTGDYGARVFVHDDDPAPDVAVTRSARTVSEGSAAKWAIHLSEPVDYRASLRWSIVKPASGVRSLRTNDVPTSWLRDLGVRPPNRPVALWRVKGLGGSVFYGIGQTDSTVRVPSVVDGRRENREVVVLRVRGKNVEVEPTQRSIGVR